MAVGTPVQIVHASDADAGPVNNLIGYSIHTVQDSTSCGLAPCGAPLTGAAIPFAISGGAMTTSSLFSNSSAVATYDVTVRATDGGVPPLSSNVVVRVTIDDVVNTTAQFNLSAYDVAIFEHPHFDDVIMTVNAISPAGAGVSHTLAVAGNEAGLFTIDAATGQLSTNAANRDCSFQLCLDFETTPSYALTVIATLTSATGVVEATSVAVDVAVLDINDHAPVFTQPTYGGSIVENAIGLTVTTVVATDADSGRQGVVHYRMRTFAVPFVVDAVSGVVTNTRSLDREAVGPPVGDAFTFEIEAFNPNYPVSIYVTAVTVTVRISDANDEVPLFADGSVKAITVADSQQTLTPVLTLSGTDGDLASTNNAAVNFRIVGGNAGAYWTVSSAGVLELVRSLDANVLQQFNLTVEVHDNGTPQLSSQGVLLIQVVRDTTLIPAFTTQSYTASVYENATVGTSITTITATDPNGNAIT